MASLVSSTAKKWFRFSWPVFLAMALGGCLAEANFDLAAESPLPGWFALPEGESRADYRMTMDCYVYPGRRVAVFKLYKIGWPFWISRVEGTLHEPVVVDEHTTYPGYEVVTVDGITEIIEQRRPDATIYINDDPVVRREIEAKFQLKL